MNKNFNVKNMVVMTATVAHAHIFNSWRSVVMMLDKENYNSWEAEAILTNKAIFKNFLASFNENKVNFNSSDFRNYLLKVELTHLSPKMNKLVMSTFAKEHRLELDKNGVPCHRGTMPGNYHPDKTILVPVGTPACCSPITETYWSM